MYFFSFLSGILEMGDRKSVNFLKPEIVFKNISRTCDKLHCPWLHQVYLGGIFGSVSPPTHSSVPPCWQREMFCPGSPSDPLTLGSWQWLLVTCTCVGQLVSWCSQEKCGSCLGTCSVTKDSEGVNDTSFI